MRLTKIALLAFKDTPKAAKERIAEALGVNVTAVYRWIKENQPNGDLTKATALKIISEETGLLEQDLLEDDTVEEGTGSVEEERKAN